jgi:hypothetical protein
MMKEIIPFTITAIVIAPTVGAPHHYCCYPVAA